MYITPNLETSIRQSVRLKQITANYNRMRSALVAIELELPNVTKHLDPHGEGWQAAMGIMDFIDSILDRDEQHRKKVDDEPKNADQG